MRARHVVLACSILVLGLGLGACKKQIDITSVDSGTSVTADPVTNSATQGGPEAKGDTATPGASGASGSDSTVEPLAPLQGGEVKKPTPATTSTGKKPTPAGTASGGKKDPTPPATGTTPPAGAQPAECVQAAKFCSHPAYATDVAIKNLCESKKAECTKKGGHL